MARGAVLFVAWWLALAVLWLFALGVVTRTDLVAALLAGAASACAVLVVRRQELLGFHFRLRWLLAAPSVPWQIVRELAVVLLALARRPRSRWEERTLPGTRQDAKSAAWRAFAAWAATLSPNTIVVDLDAERDVALVHDLDPRRASRSLL